jgi:hypothetical protein
MVERQLPKLHTRVRFPSPAPILSGTAACGIYPAAIGATADNIGYQPATVCPLMTQSGHRIQAETSDYARYLFSLGP